MRHKHSEYMHWAKTHVRGRYNLTTSGVGPFPLIDLPVDTTKLEINGPNSYGYVPLQKAIAHHLAVDPDCVVEAAGTSFANHLALAALLEPGDEVLIEHPCYGPILDATLYLGAEIRRFFRTEESGYAVDPVAVGRAITPRTRLIILTNLHNPSSVLTPEPVLREVGDLARSIGARVLVDEAYLDAVYEGTPPTAFLLGEEFVTTSSLTKLYGVSGLRCGWILAQPDLARKMRLLNDVFGATPVYPGEVLSVAAFDHLDLLRARARRVVEADRVTLAAFLERETAVTAPRTEWGTTCFLRLRSGPADEFLEHLRDRYDTSAVPGRFFEMPGSFRIGMGVDSAMFGEGLKRLSLGLLDHLQ